MPANQSGLEGCQHRDAIQLRGGTLYPDLPVYGYSAAWCSACGALREESATTDGRPWILVGEKPAASSENKERAT